MPCKFKTPFDPRNRDTRDHILPRGKYPVKIINVDWCDKRDETLTIYCEIVSGKYAGVKVHYERRFRLNTEARNSFFLKLCEITDWR